MPTDGVDGIYSRRAWNTEPETWSYQGPFSSQQEKLVHQALTSIYLTREEIGDEVRAPLPQVAVFRPRMGFPTYAERQATITDIVAVPKRIDAHGSWFSGGPAGFTGSSRYSSNSLGMT